MIQFKNYNLKQNKKIPLTVQCLISLYNTIEKIDDITFPAQIKPLKDMICSDYSKFMHDIVNARERRKFQKLIDRLIRRNYLKRISKNNNAIIITPIGLSRIVDFTSFNNYDKRQDGKWQMVTFDIPEKLHKTRDRFRRELKILKFRQLQQSIWISPFDTFKELKRIVKYYKIEEYVHYFLIREQEFQ